ncbi:MBL fold metallo-hydrolase RNA specificity domain-containing protein [Chloroflexota bacterium]
MTSKLSFLGAAGNVTGSCYLLKVKNTRLLVDCGLYQERKFQSRNWEPFPFNPQEIDAVLLTHAHVDHCGRIPKLVREGFHGKIYCNRATADIAEIILLDSAHIQEQDAAFKKRRHDKEGRRGPFPEIPLYTTEDADNSLQYFSPVDYGVPVNVGDGIEVSFYDAGHVLGSSMIKVLITEGEQTKKIIFSGDVGRWDRPILHDPKVFSTADYVVVESTYGDRVHESVEDIPEKLARIINETRKAHGNIIVPSFALERTQEILYYLNDLLLDNLIPHLMVFIDSPMAIKITEVFKRHSQLFDRDMASLIRHNNSPFEFPGLKMVQTVDESKSLNHIDGTIMVIAGSGMCNGGRIKHHLVNNITRPESTILFVGYQAIGTLGRIIIDGAKRVRIFGQEYSIKAKIENIHGFSAHADKDELSRWLAGFQSCPQNIFVTHGEEKASRSFADFLRKKTGCNVSAPQYLEEVTL